ncbi:Nop52-domain-containing protein [Vararia minispora EC-137]|uniref:Nop52-domain-containing protein n=1 Tax=Vararia minispora EC-137 TaxID=1314806 RepID=A0ACB8QXL8_9AGAM|nr:Nop52-domain-containing protein [Vararia minispora EC-137]
MTSSTSSSSNAPPLGKFLASTDKATRDSAIKGLGFFLSEPENAHMAEQDMAKLWKGIFYCFWMSDKPLVQQALASELAEVMLNINPVSSALNFLEGFWQCMVREWNGIDRLRVDKYYMLIRRYVNASFRLLMRAGWSLGTIDEYNKILVRQGGPLCPTHTRVPPSLAYHLCDIYLEELEKVLADLSNQNATPPSVPLGRLLDPFLTLAARTTANPTVRRIISVVLEPLIESLQYPQYAESLGHKRRQVLDQDLSVLVDHACLFDPETEGRLDRVSLHRGIVKHIFDTACDHNSRDSNRRKMYSFWKQHALELEDQEAAPLSRTRVSDPS